MKRLGKGLFLLSIAMLAVSGGPRAGANTIQVDTDVTVDADTHCSLIEAIVTANMDAATHPDCTAGSGPDVLNLVTNHNYAASAAYYTGAYSGDALPPITSDITIQGNNATISRFGSPRFRLLEVSSGGTLTLNNLTVTGGYTYDGVLPGVGEGRAAAF